MPSQLSTKFNGRAFEKKIRIFTFIICVIVSKKTWFQTLVLTCLKMFKKSEIKQKIATKNSVIVILLAIFDFEEACKSTLTKPAVWRIILNLNDQLFLSFMPVLCLSCIFFCYGLLGGPICFFQFLIGRHLFWWKTFNTFPQFFPLFHFFRRLD